MDPSRKSGNRILGTVTRAAAERLLRELANLHDDGSSRKLRAHHPDAFGNIFDHSLIQFRDILRLAWTAHDVRHRDWFIFQLRDYYCACQREYELSKRPDDPYPREVSLPSGGTVTIWPASTISAELEGRRLEPPPETKFEATMFYFQRSIAERTKFCPVPGCTTPYFIAAKRRQKYCSVDCAESANLEAKRKWWHENRGGGVL
jgi:hypothetical protein